MKPLQIAADGDRLGETCAVVELQHRHSAGRVLCKKFGSPALASENIDILQRELDPLFRREDANPAGIWGECMIVKLHCISHFEPSKAPRDGFIARGSEFSLLAASSLSVSRLAHTLSSRTWEIAHEIDQPTAFADEKIAVLSCGGRAHGDLRRQHADPK